MEKQEYFEYKEKGKTYYFHTTKEGGFMCWKCGGTYKRIVKHLQYKESCRGNFDMDQLKMKLREYSLNKIRKDQNSRRKKCTDKKREKIGNALVKKYHNSRQKRSIDRRRVEIGPCQLRKELNERKSKSRKRQIGEDPEKLRIEENKRKGLSRKRQRVENHYEVKENQKKWKSKSRLVDSRKTRLKKFRENTMYNAIFVCSCCHRKLFHSNVTKLTENLKGKVD